MSDFTQLLVAALATWRITHLLTSEDGPGHVFVRLRMWLGQSFAGQLLDCFQCLSLWVAAPVAAAVATSWMSWLLTFSALSGAACLLERATATSLEIVRERREDDELLRTTPAENSGADGIERLPPPVLHRYEQSSYSQSRDGS